MSEERVSEERVSGVWVEDGSMPPEETPVLALVKWEDITGMEVYRHRVLSREREYRGWEEGGGSSWYWDDPWQRGLLGRGGLDATTWTS